MQDFFHQQYGLEFPRKAHPSESPLLSVRELFLPYRKTKPPNGLRGNLRSFAHEISIGGTFVMLILYGRTGRNMNPRCKKPTPGKEMKNQSLVCIICQLIKLGDCFPKTKNPTFRAYVFYAQKAWHQQKSGRLETPIQSQLRRGQPDWVCLRISTRSKIAYSSSPLGQVCGPCQV